MACSACRDLLPLMEYHFNKDFIKTVLCINKDKPEMKCDGKCYLKKTIAASHQQEQNKPFPQPHENIPGILQGSLFHFTPTIWSETQAPLMAFSNLLLPGAIHYISHPPERIHLI